MTTAAATLSWGSRSRSLTPWVLRPGGADGFGVDADDLAELADDHELAVLVDEVDAGDLPNLATGLQDRIPKMGIPQK